MAEIKSREIGSPFWLRMPAGGLPEVANSSAKRMTTGWATDRHGEDKRFIFYPGRINSRINTHKDPVAGCQEKNRAAYRLPKHRPPLTQEKNHDHFRGQELYGHFTIPV